MLIKPKSRLFSIRMSLISVLRTELQKETNGTLFEIIFEKEWLKGRLTECLIAEYEHYEVVCDTFYFTIFQHIMIKQIHIFLWIITFDIAKKSKIEQLAINDILNFIYFLIVSCWYCFNTHNVFITWNRNNEPVNKFNKLFQRVFCSGPLEIEPKLLTNLLLDPILLLALTEIVNKLSHIPTSLFDFLHININFEPIT